MTRPLIEVHPVAFILFLAVACGGGASEGPPHQADGATQVTEEESNSGGETHEDQGAAAEARVTLSDTAMRTAGIRTDTVAAHASGLDEGLVVPFNAGREGPGHPRAAESLRTSGYAGRRR